MVPSTSPQVKDLGRADFDSLMYSCGRALNTCSGRSCPSRILISFILFCEEATPTVRAATAAKKTFIWCKCGGGRSCGRPCWRLEHKMCRICSLCNCGNCWPRTRRRSYLKRLRSGTQKGSVAKKAASSAKGWLLARSWETRYYLVFQYNL